VIARPDAHHVHLRRAIAQSSPIHWESFIDEAGGMQGWSGHICAPMVHSKGSVRNNHALRHMLRSGTTSDVISVLGNQTFHSFGAKVISWLEPPDDTALNSRCVFISMFETTRTDLVRPGDIEVMREAAKLQAQLLQFRFENYYRIEPGPVPGDDVLRPRSRDLLRVLAATHSQDVSRSGQLLKFFASG
jgi:hypothetical protein